MVKSTDKEGNIECHKEATPFAICQGPDEFKHDPSIDILTKYKDIYCI